MSAPVNVNVRIRRVDGKPMRFAEARRALLYLRTEGHPPDGYLVAGCDWQNPEKSSTTWESSRRDPQRDVDALSAPLYIGEIKEIKAVRLGAVKS